MTATNDWCRSASRNIQKLVSARKIQKRCKNVQILYNLCNTTGGQWPIIPDAILVLWCFIGQNLLHRI